MEPLLSLFGIGAMVALIILASGVAKKLAGGSTRTLRVKGAGKALSGKRHTTTRIVTDLSERQLELEALKLEERRAARETYERLVREKLDVIKLAVSMGYDQQELKALDQRLEQIVGKDKLASVLNEDFEVPKLDGDILDDDLQSEIDRLAQLQQQVS